MTLATRLSAVLITGLLVSQLAHAGNPHDVAYECIDIAHQLNRFAESYRSNVCSGDIEIASAYIEAAGNEFYRGKNEQALRSIIYGEHELSEISSSRIYCSKLAPEAKFFLARVIRLKSEVELMGFTKQ